MADNIAITPGSGATYAADELTDGTLGSVKVGYTKIMDGTLDSSNKLVVNSSGEAKVAPTANSTVDLNKVAGASIATGHGTASGAVRVELPTDGTGVIATVGAVTAITNALPAGTALLGKVGIDQTTPGTTNKVNIGNDGTVGIVNPADTTATANITVVDSGTSSATGANGQVLITGSPTASSAATFTLAAQNTIRVQVTGTWTGTLSSEISIDGGTTYVAQGLHQGAFTTATFTANFVGGASTAGATHYRLRATATVTGTAVVKVAETINEHSTYLANAAPSGNYVSLLNSTTATLTSGSVFTGTGEDVSNFNQIRISLIASHVSATDGLSIQQSSDNTNWDITDTYTIPATTGKTFAVPRQAKYFRVVYTNGGTNQSSFRLQTIFDRVGPTSTSQRPQDAYSNENDMEQVWNLNSAWNGTTWDRIPGDTTGMKVKQVAGTATLSNVAASASSVTLLSANTARIGAQITNDSSAVIYIKFGTTASTTSYTVSLAGAASAPFAYYEVPAGYTGRIDAIWASATGNARITEET